MFSMCSELTPRSPVPDNRIPQLMQPCSKPLPAISDHRHLRFVHTLQVGEDSATCQGIRADGDGHVHPQEALQEAALQRTCQEASCARPLRPPVPCADAQSGTHHSETSRSGHRVWPRSWWRLALQVFWTAQV